MRTSVHTLKAHMGSVGVLGENFMSSELLIFSISISAIFFSSRCKSMIFFWSSHPMENMAQPCSEMTSLILIIICSTNEQAWICFSRSAIFSCNLESSLKLLFFNAISALSSGEFSFIYELYYILLKTSTLYKVKDYYYSIFVLFFIITRLYIWWYRH